MVEDINQRKLLTVREFSKAVGIAEGGVRHLIFCCETNGFKSVMRRIGRRVYLSVVEFYIWVDLQNGIKK